MRIFKSKGFLPVGLVSLMLTISTQVFAQRGADLKLTEVSGIVTDAALGTPMVGVRVQAYNDSWYSAMTTEDGSYTIKVPDFVTSLTFVLDDCNTTVCALRGRTADVDVQMYSDQFSEVYSRKTTGARSKVSEISSMNADLSVDNQIKTDLMGDIFTSTRSGQLGVGSMMLLNGVNSINTNTQPLVVIDGIIMDMGYDNVSMHDGFYNNVLANIMVEDIQKVTVLKNGLAVYGAKGANGVILIETKRNTSMATKIDLSIAANYQTLPKFPTMMNATQYRSYVSELLGTTDTKMNSFKFLQTDKSYHYYNTYHNDTDWTETSYDQALIQNYSLNVQGGDEIANYNLSVGYAFGDATLKNNDYSRFNLRLNSDIVLSDKMSLRFDAYYSDVTRDLRDDGATEDIDNSMTTSTGFLSLIKSPFLSPYAYDNNHNISQFLSDNDDYLDEVLGEKVSLANPLSILNNGEGVNKNYYGNRLVSLSITPSYEFSRYLHLKEHFGYTLINADENYYLPLFGTPTTEIEGVGEVDNKASAMNAKQDGFMSNTYIDFAKRFNAHDVQIQAGFRYLNNALYQTTMIGYNSTNDKTPNMTSSLKFKDTDGLDKKDISLTYWAQGNYNYKERYYASASIGISSSSRFGGDVSNGLKMAGVPWGIFPSIQGAWIASAEPWFKVNFIDYLKVSAGFDLTGNDGFDDAASRTYFAPVKVLEANGLAMANIGNSSLQWETTKKITTGIDLSLLKNRLGLSVNYYHSITDNLLSTSSLSYLTGLPNTLSNGGSLKNDGFDVTVTGKIVNNSDVKLEAGFSMGGYKTEITKLPDNDKSFVTEIYGANIKTEVGHGVGYFYGYKTDGVYSTSADAKADGLYIQSSTGKITYFDGGDVKFVDMNDDKIIDEKDMTEIGDPNPELYGRIFANMSYKAFTLSTTFSYALGNDIFNYQRMILESGSRFNNQTVAMTNRWTCEGQVTEIPRLSYEDPMDNSRFSDRWIEDGSYLRLNNVTLSYKVPINNSYIHGITVWGAANNLFTITKYLGSDPEFSMSNDIKSLGIDRGLLPQSMNFSLGVKINL